MKTATQTAKTETEHVSLPMAQRKQEGFFSAKRSQVEPFFGPVSIQAKLEIGQPNDPYEREADKVADQVMRMSNSGIQIKCTSCEDEDKIRQKTSIQRIVTGNNGALTASPEIASKISSTRGSGNPLPKNTQNEMGGKIGADFSGVKIHTDSMAVQLNQDLCAKAFTVGNDIYFNKGQYNPSSGEGKRLMAHELVHTLQHGEGVIGRINLQNEESERPGRGATVPTVRNWLITETCPVPPSGKEAAYILSDRELRIILASGWEPNVLVNQDLVNNARRIINIEENIMNDPNVQTFLKVEFLVRNAEVIKGHLGDNQLHYPGEYPGFNTFSDQLKDEGLMLILGEILGQTILSNEVGFALDVAMAIFANYTDTSKMQEQAIRQVIIGRLDGELSENIRAMYRAGGIEYSRLERSRQLLWELIMRSSETRAGYDKSQISSAD